MKNTNMYVILTALIMSLSGGCGKTLTNVEKDSQAVWEVRLAVEDALRREDTEALMKLWTEDAMFYVPNAGMSTGKEEIREAHGKLFDEFDDIEFKFKRLAIKFPTPDVAIEDVSYVFTATDLKSDGRDVTVLVKRDGRWWITAVLDLIPMAPAEGTTEETEDNNEEDVKAIRKLFDDFCEAHKYGDGVKLAEFYTDDAMLMPSDEPIVSGKVAIASRYQRDFEDFTVELVTIPDEIDVSGNLGFVRGTFTVKLTPKAEGEKIEITFKAISILRKGTDGSWKLYCDIWNSDAPLPPKPKDQTVAPLHQFELIPTDNPMKISEGIYQVGWIKVSSANDESHNQTIPVEMDEPYVHWVQWGLEKDDVNFDGYTDIAVRQHGGAKWGKFFWWLYDPKTRQYYSNSLTEELSKLTFAQFWTVPETKEIKTKDYTGTEPTEYTYRIVEGHLRQVGLAGPRVERAEYWRKRGHTFDPNLMTAIEMDWKVKEIEMAKHQSK
ncbi:MAG: YybH family protein [Planctomycetota bacterium]|jgi:uncharacterized protein (TIGR02246 family)